VIAAGRTVVRTATIGSFVVREVECGAGLVLDQHAHATSRFCIVVGGRYREEYAQGHVDCAPSTVTFRPAGAMHVNRFFEATRCLTIESSGDVVLPCARATSDARTVDIALQIRREMLRRDSASGLILEGLVLQLAGLLARDSRTACDWLSEIRDRLQRERATSLSDIAFEYGVHPSYLATVFRRRFGCTIGELARARRIEVAAQLLSGDSPLAQVALDAGFADHSHFAREFKRAVGLTPSQFRRQTKI
jgi:AraC family transcriptional regulator